MNRKQPNRNTPTERDSRTLQTQRTFGKAVSENRYGARKVSLRPSVSSSLFTLFVAVVALLLVTAALAAPAELPSLSAKKSGEPTWNLNNSNIVGDRGTYSRPSFADLDADGDYDMLLGHSGGQVEYWRNIGSAKNASWSLISSDLVGVYTSYSEPSLYDSDKDGDFDLYVGYSNGNIRYFRNTGTESSPTFTYVKDVFIAPIDNAGNTAQHSAPFPFDYDGNGQMDFYLGNYPSNVYKIKNDVLESGIDFRDFDITSLSFYPTVALKDIDNDGDADAFLGRGNGQVFQVKNLGSASNAVWGDLEFLFDSGDYSVPSFGDLDSDGDFDLIIGDNDGTLKYYRNDGSATTPFWTNVPSFFSLDAGDRSAPTFADIDNDGDLDLYVGNTAGATNFYQNQGSASSPSFVLSSSPISDVGSYSKPTFVDLDQDSDFDLAVGRDDGVVVYFKNNGNVSVPSYSSSGNVLNDWHDFSTPSFADLDNDGDLDLATATGDDTFGWASIIKNTGSATNFSFSNARTWGIDNDIYGLSCDFVDADLDGDFDRYCGREDGWVFYQPNSGTAQVPAWTQTKYILNLNNHAIPAIGDIDGDGDLDILVGQSSTTDMYYFADDSSKTGIEYTQINDPATDGGDWSNPWLTDLDADGDFDLVVGYADGFVKYFKNNGNASQYNFTLNNSNLIGDQGDYAAPALGDLDGDGDLDMLVGQNTQSLYYYRNDGDNNTVNFTLASSNYLGSNCKPSGGNIRCDPNLVDFDSDGDLDIVLSQYSGQVVYWRNDGNPSVAAWSHQGDLIGSNGVEAKMGIGDIDGDGDLDIIQTTSGTTFLYQNIGTATSPALQFTYRTDMGGTNAFIPDLGDHMSLAIQDIDNDGDMDIVSGETSGRLFLFRNQGVPTNLQNRIFGATYLLKDTTVLGSACNPLQGSAYCSPVLEDFDADGDLDLMVSNYYREPRYWRNDGSTTQYSFTSVASYGTDIGDFYKISAGDIDSDGDIDLLASVVDGTSQLIKNIGTAKAPNWVPLYRGADGRRYFTDFGDTTYTGIVDIDGDGKQDLWISEAVGAGNGRSRFFRNSGIVTTQTKRALDSTYLFDGLLITSLANYAAPTGADFDGDGDTDLLVGDESNRVQFYRNKGDNTFTSAFTVFDDGSLYAGPAAVDLDGDGAIDFASGYNDGFVTFRRNTGQYQVATTVTLVRSSNPVMNATVTFADASGTVCQNVTNTLGKVSCGLVFVGDKATITVTNAQGANISLGVFSPNSNGKTFMTLENTANTAVIQLERISLNTFDVSNSPATLSVEISDRGKTVLGGKANASGFIDGFLPKRYLVNKLEPFTQNRITYDIDVLSGSGYANALSLSDIYVPNEIQAGASAEQNKLYKFLATHEMSSDARYKGYVIYPALKAQRNYALTDSLPVEFDFVGDVKVSYLGQSCTFAATNTSNISISATGCSLLNSPVQSNADWVVFQYTIAAPNLDYFITNGFNSTTFVIPAANLGLVS